MRFKPQTKRRMAFLSLLLLVSAFIFFENESKPTFTNIIGETNIQAKSISKGVSWIDYNSDGILDLLLVGQGDGNKLYKGDSEGRFIDVTAKSRIDFSADNWAAAFGDYDNDGCPDLYISSSGPRDKPGLPDNLYHNNCNGTFANVSIKAGIFDTYHGRGVAWADYNADGYLDIYVANHGPWDTDIDEPNLLYKNSQDGTFSEVAKTAGVLGFTNCPDNEWQKQSFQPIWFDYDNDGFVDIFVLSPSHNPGAKFHSLYKNKGGRNNWLTIKLTGTKSNRDAVGAQINLKKTDGVQTRQIISGSSYLAQNSLWQTFGLGSERFVETLEIKWPDGTTKTLYSIKANKVLEIREEE